MMSTIELLAISFGRIVWKWLTDILPQFSNLIEHATSAHRGELELSDQIFSCRGIKYITPLGFSQRFETQRSLPDKVFGVGGSWRCCLSFRVDESQQALQKEWLSMKIRVCSACLLHGCGRPTLINYVERFG